jgi:hypothetical protein
MATTDLHPNQAATPDARSVRVLAALTLTGIVYAAITLIVWRLFLDGRLRGSFAQLDVLMRVATFVGWWLLLPVALSSAQAIRVWRAERRAAWKPILAGTGTLIAAAAIFLSGMSMQLKASQPLTIGARQYSLGQAANIVQSQPIYVFECDAQGGDCRAVRLGAWDLEAPVRLEAGSHSAAVIICTDRTLEDCETFSPFGE